MLTNAILLHRGVMAADKTIKFNSSQWVLKLQVGDAITLITGCSHFAYSSLAAGTERASEAVVINSRDDCHLPFVGFPRRLRHVENDIHQLIRLTLRAAGGRISRSGAR
jgi:hypothetical protein